MNCRKLRLSSSRQENKDLKQECTVMPRVQRLYEVCKVSFGASEGAPSPEAVELMTSVLDTMKGSDVGLQDPSQNELAIGRLWSKRNSSYRPGLTSGRAPHITYLHLHEIENFLSMGVFCLPAGASIPLHNHPGMTVFSKLLYGSMHVRSFDLIEPSDEDPIAGSSSKARLAKLVEDHVITAPCETEVLYPTSKNIHCFTALTSCAVLDVLSPPYSTKDGRRFSYYEESGLSGGIEEMMDHANLDLDIDASYSWLQEFQPSKSFVVKEGIYRGPKLRP